jgi:Zn-dependent metalloprotease
MSRARARARGRHAGVVAVAVAVVAVWAVAEALAPRAADAAAPAAAPPGWSVLRDEATGRVRFATRTRRSGAPAAAKSLPDAARAALAEWAPALGLAPDLSDLAVTSERQGLARRVVVFEQRVDGLPVLGAEVAVTFVGGEPVALASAYVPPGAGARGAGAPAALDAVLAIERARAAIAAAHGRGAGLRTPAGPDADPSAPRAAACWFPAPDGALRRAFEVRLPLEEPPGDWRAVVDAATGEVLVLEDASWRAHAPARTAGAPTGRVFNPNPVVTLQNLTLTDQNDADQSVFDPAYQTVSLDSARFIGGVYRLEGPYVRVADIATPLITPPTSASGDFTTTRANDAFEAVMVFYHIDAAQRHIQSLGFTNVANFQIAADAHGFGDLDNSAYFPSTNDVRFGDGCVDDAEDADVIYHEYGHAIQDNQVPGFGASVSSRSLGEGFGDYWASSLAARSSGSYPDTAQVFDWDLGPAEGCWLGRRVDSLLTMTDDYINSPDPPARYINGMIWSGALWRIRSDVGADVADRLVLESHFSLLTNATFAENAQSILLADAALYGGAHAAAIENAFAERGIVPDTVAPKITLGVLQNPVLTAHLDLVVISSEALNPATSSGTAGGDPVGFAQQDAAARFLRAEYRLTAPGVLTIDVSMRDRAGNQTDVGRLFTAAKTAADVATTVSSPDGRFTARVPAGALPGETWILVGAADPTDLDGKAGADAEGSAYLIGPVGARPNAPVEVTLAPPAGGSLDGARLALLETGEALDTWLDAETGALTASLPVLGTVVTRPAGAPLPRLDRAFLALAPAVPNPAPGSMRIAFEVRAPQRVSLAVYNVAGERVRALLSASVPPGTVAADWDGRDDTGRRVGSGVYILRLEGERAAASRKVTVLR